jgi:hypothetical protein
VDGRINAGESEGTPRGAVKVNAELLKIHQAVVINGHVRQCRLHICCAGRGGEHGLDEGHVGGREGDEQHVGGRDEHAASFAVVLAVPYDKEIPPLEGR